MMVISSIADWVLPRGVSFYYTRDKDTVCVPQSNASSNLNYLLVISTVAIVGLLLRLARELLVLVRSE